MYQYCSMPYRVIPLRERFLEYFDCCKPGTLGFGAGWECGKIKIPFPFLQPDSQLIIAFHIQ